MSHQGKMITGIVGNINVFKEVEFAELKIEIDSSFGEITGLDFTQTNGYNEIAAIIQTSLRGFATGGFTNAVVTASADLGDDVRFTFMSGTTEGMNSYVSTLYPLSDGLGTDISGLKFLNGQEGNMLISLDITLVDATDMTSIKDNNAEHSITLSIMDFFNENTQSPTGNCIEMDIVEMPAYQDWYDVLNVITPFSSRTITNITIDNN